MQNHSALIIRGVAITLALVTCPANAEQSDLAAKYPLMKQAVKIYSICVASKLQDLGASGGEARALAEAIIPLCSVQYRNIVISYVNEIKPEIRRPVAQRMMVDEKSFAIRTILRLRKPSASISE